MIKAKKKLSRVNGHSDREGGMLFKFGNQGDVLSFDKLTFEWDPEWSEL